MSDLEDIVLKALHFLINDSQPFDEDALSEEDFKCIIGNNDDNDDFKPKIDGVGYPSGKLFLHLTDCLKRWMKCGNVSWLVFRKYDLLEEGDYPEIRKAKFEALNDSVCGSSSLWSHWNTEEKVFFIKELILKLGKRGLLDMFGLRKTTGSHTKFPPAREILIDAFEKQSIERSNLSAGARALAKHHHRDSSATFWGVSTGTEAAKNEHARRIVDKILDGATWINIHELPGQLPILEIRVHEGYGARWSTDGESFRGFLEPMMEEGWVNKYRH